MQYQFMEYDLVIGNIHIARIKRDQIPGRRD
jgi:hypothetical protein